jgi:hypothetical protein
MDGIPETGKRSEPLAENLRKLLADFMNVKDINQQDLANLIEMPSGSLKHVLKGDRLSRRTREKVERFIKDKGLRPDNLGLIPLNLELSSPQPVDDKIISSFRDLMITRNLTQKAAGKIVGLQQTTFMQVLRGDKVTPKTRKIAEEFYKRNFGEVRKEAIAGPSEQKASYSLGEANERSERLKLKLMELEIDLRYFKDSSKEVRDALRRELDWGDVGYLTSLLMMLSSEDQFVRWRSMTSRPYCHFRAKGKVS